MTKPHHITKIQLMGNQIGMINFLGQSQILLHNRPFRVRKDIQVECVMTQMKPIQPIWTVVTMLLICKAIFSGKHLIENTARLRIYRRHQRLRNLRSTSHDLEKLENTEIISLPATKNAELLTFSN